MRLFRSTFLGALALAVAGCGDKVTTGVITPAPQVRSVAVAPTTAVMVIGQSINLTAAVSADAGATYTVAWTTSDASKVTVSPSTGAIAAVAVTPGVAVCAAAGGKQGCASITVVDGRGIQPATVSITSITVGNLNTPAPVPPGQVAGQFDVRLNVTANSVALDSVVVYVDNVSTVKQTFTAAQAAALLTASEEIAGQSLPVTIVLSINSAACKLGTNLQAVCNFANTNVSWLNASTNGGNNRAISAKAFGKFAGTTTASVSPTGQSVPLAFGNTSGWFAKMTLAPASYQAASGVDAAGFIWKTGGMSVDAKPLIYYLQQDGVTVQGILQATLQFSTGGCDTQGGGIRTQAMTVAAGVWNAVFTNISVGATGAGNANNIGSYEFNPIACPGLLASGGEQVQIVAIGTDNNNFAGAVFAQNTTSNFNANPDITVRLDNVGPSGITATTTPNGRTGNWMNDAVILNGLNTAFPVVAASLTSANGIVTAGADLGMGRVIGIVNPTVFTARVGLAGDASATVDATAAVTSLSGVAESATASTYRIRLRGTDPLGNFRNLSVGNVGRDNTAPALTFIGGTAANARLGAYSATSYTFSVADPATAPAAPSGFFNLSALPLSVSQTRRNVAATQFFCPTSIPPAAPTGQYQASGTACGLWSGGTNFAANLVVAELNGIATPPVDAYYTTAATVTDQAGNVSSGATRVQLDDITPPAIALLAPTSYVAGGMSQYTGAMADNLDLQLMRVNLVYAGLAGVLNDQATGVAWVGFSSALGASAFWIPDVQLNAYNGTPLVPTAQVTVAAQPTMTNVQVATGATGVNPAALGLPITQTFGFVFNQANAFGFAIQNVLAPQLPPAAAITNTGAGPSPGPAGGPQTWQMTNTAGTTAISISGAGGLATSITLNATAQGATGVFQNPFSVVQFWAYDDTPLTAGWHLINSVGANATSDNGVNRFWTFTTTWAPNAASAPTTAACPGGTTYRVVAVGIGGTNLPAAQQGMALATPLSQRVVTVCP